MVYLIRTDTVNVHRQTEKQQSYASMIVFIAPAPGRAFMEIRD